ncbi:MAG: carbohydrate-binding protein [Verrucomicrobiota bacterium]
MAVVLPHVLAETVYSIPESVGSTASLSEKKAYSCDSSYYVNSGFAVNGWGGGSLLATPEYRTGYYYSAPGSQCFKITAKGTGDAQLLTDFLFNGQTIYRVSAKMRADTAVKATMFVRQADFPYTVYLIKTVDLDTTWKSVEIEGMVMTPNSRLRFAQSQLNQNVYIDDIHISEVTKNLYAPAKTDPIPDSLFGIVFNKLFPTELQTAPTNHQFVRAWDTHTCWLDLEKSPGNWDWNRMDIFVDSLRINNPNMQILYTMGQVPQWASSNPGDTTAIYGPGASALPKDMNLWRNYVHQVATRYKGKIRYYELWNEYDYKPHFAGTVDEMVELARITKEELLKVDPSNKLTSPSVTRYGLQALESFIQKGGDDYIDIVAFHVYPGQNVESADNRSLYLNTLQMLKNYDLDDLPLWNTEGCTQGSKTLTSAEWHGLQIRNLLTMRAGGLDAFMYYFYEGFKAGQTLGLATGNTTTGWITPTDEGKGYKVAVKWLRSAQILDAYLVNPDIYVYKLRRGNTDFEILYTTGTPKKAALPSQWKAISMEDMQGTLFNLAGNQTVQVSVEPVLITNTPTTGVLVPFKGTPTSIPGRIQAEDYDFGGEGVSYHDVDPTNHLGAYRFDGVDIRVPLSGGYVIGNSAAGEWQKYTVQVNTTGTYTISARICTLYAGKTFTLKMDGITILGPVAIPITGGNWDSWRVLTFKGIPLAAGKHVLQIITDTGAFDIDYLDFSLP